MLMPIIPQAAANAQSSPPALATGGTHTLPVHVAAPHPHTHLLQLAVCQVAPAELDPHAFLAVVGKLVNSLLHPQAQAQPSSAGARGWGV